MKQLKNLIWVGMVLSLMVGIGVAADAPSKAKKLTCCEEARAKKKACTHNCCINAHRKKESCTRCNPNREDLEKPEKKPAKKS